MALSNADRVYYGVGTIAGLNATMNADAQQAIGSDTDPWCGDCPGFSSNWAADFSPLYAYYNWMYNDGFGSGNLDCTSPTAPGCWGHRRDTLMWSGDIAMGVGTGTSPTYRLPAYTELFSASGRSNYIPTVAGISPATGPTTGGTTLTLTGFGFQDVQGVRLGSSSAANVSVSSLHALSATTPPGTGIVHTKVVTSGGSSSASSADTFGYVITHVSHSSLALTVPAAATTTASVSLSASVTPSTATGRVTFYDGTTPLGIATVTAGTAQLVLTAGTLAVGPHSLSAAYGGDATDTASTSAAKQLAVTQLPPATFVSVTPTRLLDTRSGVGGAVVGPGGTLGLQVVGGGVPASGVSAVVLNVTVTQPTAGGYLTVWGDGTSQPTASNLNFSASQTVPNLVVAPVGADGKVAFFNGSAGSVQLIADLAGYYLASSPGEPGAFASLSPSRLLDTRSSQGGSVVGPSGTLRLPVDGHGGVPASGVSAVVLNVTVTQPTAGGYLTVWGDGTAQPTASNLNFSPGQTVPNLVIAPVGADGKVAFFNGSGGSTQLIADVAGYYLAGTPTTAGAFASLAPARLLDTRSNNGGSIVSPSGTLRLPVDGHGGVPASGVSAVVLNVTVTQPTAGGYLTVWGDGTSQPTASNLNFSGGQTVPNLVVAPVGADGKVAFFNGSAGSTQLIADVAGYYLGAVAAPHGSAVP